MKRTIALLPLLAAMLLSGCEQAAELIHDDGDSKKAVPGVTTLNVEVIDATSATLNGQLSRPAQIGNDFDFGFEVSCSEKFDKESTVIYSVEISSGDDNTFNFVAEHLMPASTYYVRAYMVNLKSLFYGNVKSFTTLELKYEYVDLGLSVKWATFNVGATSPTDYGDYFAWGETEPHYQPGYAQSGSPLWKSGKSDGYGWSTYKYCNGSSSTLTKYCTSSSYGTVDNKTVLDLTDDAARANWGGSWRMPTKAEFSELSNSSNCTWTWYASGNTEFNGVAGYKVISKKSGYEGNWIFLPAAGYRYDTSLGYAGSYGNYWSSSLVESRSGDARYLDFDSDNRSTLSRYRYNGYSVRPVFR